MCCYKHLRIYLSILLVSHIIAAQNEDRYLQRIPYMRLQPEYMKEVPFPCPIDDRNNTSPPSSVHKLRPGDIKVIAAIGDSLSSGQGAKGKSFIDFLTLDRGVGFSIGGEDTWRKYLTLPNILKLYNPNIVGYSTKSSGLWSKSSQLNAAIPAASTHDIIDQAKILIRRMKGDSRINFENDWKMITVFIGHNDICFLECFNKSAGSVAGYIKATRAGLDYLQETIPRALINLIPILDPTFALKIYEGNRPLDCRLIHLLFCMCHYIYGPDSLHYHANLVVKYQEAVEILVNSGRYDVKDDFTVVVQPWTKYFNSNYDDSKKRTIDDSHMTYECHHFSQKGHAMAANLLWNNLLEPVGNKSLKIVERIFEKFKCPSKNAPYFFTKKNSIIYHETGHQ